MAKNKSKKGGKKPSKPAEVKAEKVEKVEAETEVKEVKEEKVTQVIASEPSGNPFKGFFAPKHDKSENILTIFKTPKIWGALIGEIFGTMLIAMFFLVVGIYQPIYLVFAFTAVTAIVFSLSGAHLNPVITVGMMASRRISAIRGVLYILAQILGAWLGMLILNAFIAAGDGTAELSVMAEVADGQFWVVTFVEFLGAALLGFIFCRALAYKKSPLTFATIIGAGTCLVFLFLILISGSFLGLSNNFIVNPAVALMYQILPTSGENFGVIFGETMLALCSYVVFPMLGAVVGFAISDVASKLVGEKSCCCEKCDCKK